MNILSIASVPFFLFSYLLIFRDGYFSRSKPTYLTLILTTIPIFVLTIFLAGFRPLDAGFDTALYVNTYLSLGNIFDAREVGTSIFGNTELLWWPLQTIFRTSLDAREWLLFNCILVFLLVGISYWALRRHFDVNQWIFPFVFLTFFLVYAGNAMRQAVAAPCCLLATALYFSSRRTAALATLCFAISIHWSSGLFVFIPLFFRFSQFSPRITAALPLLCVLLSPFFVFISTSLINLLGMDVLVAKNDLYLSPERESHVGAVWQTVNFWICTIIPLLYLSVCRKRYGFDDAITVYTTFVVSMITFGIAIPDFSERLFPSLLLALPILIHRILQQAPVSNVIKSFCFTVFFVMLGIFVIFAESAQITLGYSINYY